MASTELQPIPTRPSRQAWLRGHLTAEVVFMLVLGVACFLVRLWPMSQSRFWDETVYLQNAETILGTHTNYSELSSRPPLLSLIFAAVFLLWHSIYAAAIVTAALNALAAPLLYVIGRRLVGRTAAVIAAILLAFGPFFASGGVGNSLLSDMPALTLCLLCFWMVLRDESGSGPWTAAAGFLGALAVLMRFASLPTVAIVGTLCFRTERRIRAAFQFAGGFLLGFAPYLMWSRMRYGGILATLRQGWTNVAGSNDPALFYVRNFAATFTWLTVAGLVLWIAAKLFQRNDPIDHSEQGSDSPSVWWEVYFCGWILIVLSYYMAIAHKEQRYILPLAPPLLLLAGSGFAKWLQFRNRSLRIAATILLTIAIVFTCASSFARFRSPLVSNYVSEEKSASDYLTGIAPKTAVLYLNFNYPVFAYYTGLPMRVLRAHDDGFYDAFPGNMPADGFLIVYRDLDNDPHLEWVDANPHFRRIQEFPSLIVYEYRVQTR